MNTPILLGRTRLAGLAVLVALVGLAGCGSDNSTDTSASTPAPAGTTRSYVGTVQGTEAYIAVVVDGTRALAYVCDGLPADPIGTVPTVQAWFNGTSDGKTVDVQQPAGRLRVQLTDTALTGTLALVDGRNLTLRGHTATGDAGLYRAEASGRDTRVVAGWIVDADGSQRGGVGFEPGGGIEKRSGAQRLVLSNPTFSPQGLAAAHIGKVGITPIPIP